MISLPSAPIPPPPRYWDLHYALILFNFVRTHISTCVKNICIKSMGEVGMAVPNSNQTRVVRIIIWYVPTLAFSLWCNVMYTSILYY